MDTYGGIEPRPVALHIPRLRREWEEFLLSRGLRPVAGEPTLGLYDSCDRLVGCCSLVGDVIQCVAVDSSLEGEGLTNMLISGMRSIAGERGIRGLRLFTKPEYGPTFRTLAFHTIATSPRAILMESDRRSLPRYLDYLRESGRVRGGEGRRGVIVMNANPFTLGHRYLVEEASRQVEHLFIIPVLEDSAEGYPYRLRMEMIRNGVADLSNVTLCEGSHYAVSRSTFPSYFIKEKGELTDTHITLDLNIFTTHIAPTLRASVRFVGTEPSDPLTARYNELMKELLPAAGIEVVEIGRKTIAGEPLSATSFRMDARAGEWGSALTLVPGGNRGILLADLVCGSLRQELDLTPKPGLVDRADAGAHRDMDHSLMARSIEALRPFFRRLAERGADGMELTHEEIRSIGIEGEQGMLEATGGVNTHRGALFSCGLMVCAASMLIREKGEISGKELSGRIAALAAPFEPSGKSHGGRVRREYGLRSALDEARSGYRLLFDNWLPWLRKIAGPSRRIEAKGLSLLLLKIMSEIEDTNIYYRCGEETGREIRRRAGEEFRRLEGKDEEEIRRRMGELNEEFKERNISPGGAADMLALTLLAFGLTRSETT